MIEITSKCKNEYTYGISCVKCKKCGRRFLKNGLVDKTVTPKIEKLRWYLIGRGYTGMRVYYDLSFYHRGDTLSEDYRIDDIHIYICYRYDYLYISGLTSDEQQLLNDILDIQIIN